MPQTGSAPVPRVPLHPPVRDGRRCEDFFKTLGAPSPGSDPGLGRNQTNWETLHGELGRRLGSAYDFQGHIHSVNAAGAGREDTEQQEVEDETIENYAYLDYDPLMDGNFAIKTQNRGRVHLRINANAADAIRTIPVEMINVGGASPAR